mmetsp:Transcript_29900/g.27369  ORF Transcript_29900/g.27369 Transcript_29900/m.27369 type:complete len:186 (+) Transcript_29900:523-1080(+)
MFFNLFPQERSFFNMRFILDCYHICIHELNGIFVSDFYVQNQIERLFGNKFFHYEKRVIKKRKDGKIDITKELLLRDINYDGKNLVNVPGAVDLAHDLSMKLRKIPRKYKSGNFMDMASTKNKIDYEQPKKIMRLTEIDGASDISGMDEGKAAHLNYFPKLKFNCNQISPTMANYLENKTRNLPF